MAKKRKSSKIRSEADRRLLDRVRELEEGMQQIADVAFKLGAIARSVEGDLALERLTERQREVMSSLRSGMRVSQIANYLGVSESTVRNHLRAIFIRLDVANQVELMARYG